LPCARAIAGCFLVADLAHHNDVGILPKNGSQSGRESNARSGVDLERESSSAQNLSEAVLRTTGAVTPIVVAPGHVPVKIALSLSQATQVYGPYVQEMICVMVCSPVPAVKPTSAVFPPTVPGMLIAKDVVNAAFVTVSVMVMVSVVPS
jgi:hypothetical protein